MRRQRIRGARRSARGSVLDHYVEHGGRAQRRRRGLIARRTRNCLRNAVNALARYHLGVAGPGGRIGVISDTHGLLREEALAALAGSDLIIHAGDVGNPEILERLRALAPVAAVKGNIDKAAWASRLPKATVVETGAARIYVLHDIHELDLDPAAAGVGIVISGHSHRPSQEERGGVIYLNPGSAGPRRFRLPVTVARINLNVGLPEVEIVDLTL